MQPEFTPSPFQQSMSALLEGFHVSLQPVILQDMLLTYRHDPAQYDREFQSQEDIDACHLFFQEAELIIVEMMKITLVIMGKALSPEFLREGMSKLVTNAEKFLYIQQAISQELTETQCNLLFTFLEEWVKNPEENVYTAKYYQLIKDGTLIILDHNDSNTPTGMVQ